MLWCVLLHCGRERAAWTLRSFEFVSDVGEINLHADIEVSLQSVLKTSSTRSSPFSHRKPYAIFPATVDLTRGIRGPSSYPPLSSTEQHGVILAFPYVDAAS
jgi:hypothetical protein